MKQHSVPNVLHALRLRLTGRVQGVGFRPFVWRLARRCGVRGWVQNRVGEVLIHAEGAPADLERFRSALIAEAPPLAQPVLAAATATAMENPPGFEVRASDGDAPAHIHLPPDLDVCPDCRGELFDPADRRHRYPFINCTGCGPRYTLAERLPWDRPNTAMAGFALCDRCVREYTDPADRRFHAEPVACPDCGPVLQFIEGHHTATGDDALAATMAVLKAGGIIAVKGIGGYHLVCDARNETAVARLRARKPRPHKPLAIMFPPRGKDDLDAVREAAFVDPAEAVLLNDPARPIVLLRRRKGADLAPSIAPRVDRIGAFLPASPLHHLLLADWNGPLVATSGNPGGEPVLTEPDAAQSRLAHVADAFLHHDRPILRPADDSVMHISGGGPQILRGGRGLAPFELTLPGRLASPVLAVGGHMKNTVALAWSDRLVISPHIGDLDAPRSLAVFEQVITDLQRLYRIEAEAIVVDAHPGYASHRWARERGLPVHTVFHHHAHAAQLALEHPAVDRWLVFTWDGVGLGPDGTFWGGEALLGRPGNWQRAASFRPFHPPGGEKAGREPWRSAAALCWATGRDYLAPREPALARAAWERRLNSPATTAAGRLFDAAAALAGLLDAASFEGQGPMWLEAACGDAPLPDAAPLPLHDTGDRLEADWEPLLDPLRDETVAVATRAARFHATLAATLAAQATALRARHGDFTIGLAGGVFQNRRLTERAIALLEAAGFTVHLPRQLPVNDGGLCGGQVVEYGFEQGGWK